MAQSVPQDLRLLAGKMAFASCSGRYSAWVARNSPAPSADDFEMDAVLPNPWQTVAPIVAFEDEHLRVRRDRVIQPDGSQGTYTFVELPAPIVVVLPLDDDDGTYLVRQWRYPWGRHSWEVPSGHCASGEAPETAARRELVEETELAAMRWEAFGTIQSTALFPNPSHLFLARGLRTVAGVARDAGEQDLIVRRFPFAAAVAAVMDGRISHALSVVALLKAARLLGL